MNPTTNRRPIVLVADDEPRNVRLLETLLASEGIDVDTAPDGAACLERVEAREPDLILLDVMMPGVDGYEVTRRVRAHGKHRLIPIVLVTSLSATDERVRGIEAGCDDFITKPFDTREVLARVKTLLTLSHYRRQLDEKQKLESAIRTVREGIVVCTPRWNVESANEAACRFLDLTGVPTESLLDVVARRYRLSLPPHAFADEDRPPAQFDLTRDETEDFPVLFLRASVSAQRDPSGRVSSLVVCMHDVTDLMREERLKQDFLGLISHKLRTPLTPLKLCLSLLQDETLSVEDRARTIEQMHQQVDKLGALAERLISFVATAGTAYQHGKQRIDVRDRMLSVIELCASKSAPVATIALAPGSARPVVDVHPSLFDLVFGNLVDNAVKFNTHARPHVSISISRAGSDARIAVSDNGRGIPPEQQDHLFEPFHQPQKEFTGTVPGAGLGLALVHRIVSAYGGMVEVDSRPGTGSTFTVVLPTIEEGAGITARAHARAEA